jgi:hypothetical protein
VRWKRAKFSVVRTTWQKRFSFPYKIFELPEEGHEKQYSCAKSNNRGGLSIVISSVLVLNDAHFYS